MTSSSASTPEGQRYGSIGEFLAAFRYEWSARRAWRTRRAFLRGWWNWLVLRYECELCQGCGCRVGHRIGETYWRANDDLWLEVHGSPGGTVCPRCFTLAADKKGVGVHWLAVRS